MPLTEEEEKMLADGTFEVAVKLAGSALGMALMSQAVGLKMLIDKQIGKGLLTLEDAQAFFSTLAEANQHERNLEGGAPFALALNDFGEQLGKIARDYGLAAVPPAARPQ